MKLAGLINFLKTTLLWRPGMIQDTPVDWNVRVKKNEEIYEIVKCEIDAKSEILILELDPMMLNPEEAWKKQARNAVAAEDWNELDNLIERTDGAVLTENLLFHVVEGSIALKARWFLFDRAIQIWKRRGY